MRKMMYYSAKGKAIGTLPRILGLLSRGQIPGMRGDFSKDSLLINYTIPAHVSPTAFIDKVYEGRREISQDQIGFATSLLRYNGLPFELLRQIPTRKGIDYVLVPEVEMHYVGQADAQKQPGVPSLVILRPAGLNNRVLRVPSSATQLDTFEVITPKLAAQYIEQVSEPCVRAALEERLAAEQQNRKQRNSTVRSHAAYVTC